jgi:ketosteroid isomerase-like protein/catechol 2,3-dioxygenase-like lactoylglutathione lyase family enzyme
VDREAAQAFVARLHAAQNEMYAGGSMQPLRALLSDDVTWTIPGRNALAGEYRGVAAVLEYFARRGALAHDSLRLHPGELLVGDGQHVAAMVDGSAEIDGVSHRWSTLGLYRVRAERVAACRLVALDQAAFDRIWSPAGARLAQSGAPRVAGLDHVQLAAPPGCEAEARRFYGELLGLAELSKPEPLRERGGAWFALGEQQVHVGVERGFVPARKAHPALRVAGGAAALERLAARLSRAGAPVRFDEALAGLRRFYTEDPWGNRIELLASEA